MESHEDATHKADSSFGDWLRKQASSRNIRLERLKTLFGCSQSTIDRWLNGRSLPQSRLYPAIARIFDVTELEVMQAVGNSRTEERNANANYLSNPYDPYSSKITFRQSAKQAVAEAVCNAFLWKRRADTLLLNDGTSTAEALKKFYDTWLDMSAPMHVTIRTNNIHIIEHLAPQEHARRTVEIPSGELTGRHRAILGDTTLEWARNKSKDAVCILSCNALHWELGIIGRELNERQFKSEVMQNARVLVALADQNKLSEFRHAIDISAANPPAWKRWMHETEEGRQLWVASDLSPIVELWLSYWLEARPDREAERAEPRQTLPSSKVITPKQAWEYLWAASESIDQRADFGSLHLKNLDTASEALSQWSKNTDKPILIHKDESDEKTRLNKYARRLQQLYNVVQIKKCLEERFITVPEPAKEPAP